MEHVIIGVDPHKLSATIEVVDHHGHLLGSGRYTTDQAGYAAMRSYAKTWPQRTWAIEGANGAGRPLAQRLVEAGQQRLPEPPRQRTSWHGDDIANGGDAHPLRRPQWFVVDSERCDRKPRNRLRFRSRGADGHRP